MRFRSKFEWPLLVGSVIWFGLGLAWFHKQPHEVMGWAYLVVGIIEIFLAALVVGGYFFFWWETRESGLVQRWFWSERTIPWSEVTRVGPWIGKRTHRDTLVVTYARTGPMSDRGELRIRPIELDALVRALRGHVPQAEFDLLLAKNQRSTSFR